MLPILAIALGAFAVGTTEFVVIGLLPTIGGDLGVDAASAGLLVTGYAIGIAIGGPILTFGTRRWHRPTVLAGLMVFFALAHLGLAVAPTFSLLLVGRVITASAHGAFFAIGAIVAADVAKPGQAGRAIGLMFTGLTVATILGVPLGTFVGQLTSWRVPFLAVAGLAIAAAIAVKVFVRPETSARLTAAPVRVDRPALVLALFTTVVGFGSQFVVFTFLASYLNERTGIDLGLVSVLLLVFGVASAVGSLLGGRAADRWPSRTLPFALGALALVLFAIGVLGQSAVATIVLLVVWGVAGFSLSPALQARVVVAAGPANTLASSLNISAFNVGIATGSFIGAAVVAMGGLFVTPFIAAALAGAAIIPAVLGSGAHAAALRRTPRSSPEPSLRWGPTARTQ